MPVVQLKRALLPSAVLPPGQPPSGDGLTACAVRGRATQTSDSMIRIGDAIVFIGVKFGKNLDCLSIQLAVSTDRGIDQNTDPRCCFVFLVCSKRSIENLRAPVKIKRRKMTKES